MAIDSKLEVKTQEFTRFCTELKTRLGTMGPTLQEVIDHEIARVLEKALANTDAADQNKIRERVKNRGSFTIEGKRYITNFRGKGQRVPNRIWALIQAKRARSLSRKLAKVGLAKQSLLLLAQKLGQDIAAPGYVRDVRVEFQSAEVQGNVSVQRKTGGKSYGVRIDDHSPLLRWTNGTQAWFAALAGRIGFYRQNVKRKVFDSQASIAKKYKGLLVK